jgi:cytosine/adenosine deaminase-related metal-dependent hydrolase
MLLATAAAGGPVAAPPSVLLNGTVVTMDANHRVLANGHVLVRGNLVVAVWSGSTPSGIDVRGARKIDAGPRELVFPGLINLHDHPPFAMLSIWPVPATQAQPELGRPTGREPYDFRYEWTVTSPPEQVRLVETPRSLGAPDALGLLSEMLVYAEAGSALGGETAIQGEPDDPANGLIVRDVDGTNFGRDKIDSRVPSVDNGFSEAGELAGAMAAGRVDAWLVHLAEGVRDGDRAPGDTFSSRHELTTISSLGLLTGATVILHGTALERQDFAAMQDAGAKLVWSPLSNLLLYGHTTNVYDALAEGVTVSLGTDWTPTGSKTLLSELKVADVALHDRRVLGTFRAQVPALASEQALDRLLVDMVTTNPAQTLRWPEVGSIEPGKHADLLVLRRPAHSPTGGRPASVYRSLIDATERDVRLVLVDGRAVAGDVDAVRAAGATAFSTVRSAAGGYTKAVVFRNGVVPRRLRLATAEQTLRRALRALGGDGAKPRSGPAPPSARFSYLRSQWNGGKDRALSDASFRDTVLAPRYGRVGVRLNLERIELAPLFTQDDPFFFTVVEGRRTQAGLPAAAAAPFRPYRANVNQARASGNPLAGFRARWYR